jgi:cytochrome bd-type quinol oxidase subunit 2
MFRSHFLNMVIFSGLVSVFFAFLTQTDRKERLKVMAILCLSMVILSLLVAYAMFPFPSNKH